MIRGMSRLTLFVLVVGLAGCKKSSVSQEPPPAKPATKEKRLPGPDEVGSVKGPGTSDKAPATESRFRLQPDEGKLDVSAPSDAKAGGETTVKVTLTAGDKYHVNTEFPTKITLESTKGVTIAKAELRAGGHDKDKGDADVFDEKEMVFDLKMTPAAAGSYTVNGLFKFAVCDKDGSTCLAKKEPLAIQLAAK